MCEELKLLLDTWYDRYNRPEFIVHDPISIPHMFKRKEDIEISGLFTAILSWGQRKSILSKSEQLMKMMDMQPFDFVLHAGKDELKRLNSFVYRTFNATDCLTLVWGLRQIYSNPGGMESIVSDGFAINGAFGAIEKLRNALLSVPHEKRTRKHLPSPEKGSAAKRINMFFRWMIRHDSSGIDFGLWQQIPASLLVCPLDVHTGRVARNLGLLEVKNDNWNAALSLTNRLKAFDDKDPVKYDIALFCAGLYEMKEMKIA
ncbi:MAG TPA: TIGR02757 family protein [Bacteroidales bacterium]|nr:TIGR02757 family protein [Bacteroidales bacterium]